MTRCRRTTEGGDMTRCRRTTEGGDMTRCRRTTEGRNQCCGSGIRCLFDPWIRDPEWVFFRIPDLGSPIPDPKTIF